MKRLPIVVSFVLFVALCASATYWALQFMKPAQRPMAAIGPIPVGNPSLEVAVGLFGGRAATVALASNFQLKGVVVAGNSRESVAILSADGKPPQATRMEAEVVPGVTVKEVHAQFVLLSEGGVIKRVELQEGAKSSLQFQSPVQAAQPSMMMPAPPQRTVVMPQPPEPSQPAMVTPQPAPEQLQAPMIAPEQSPAAPGMTVVTPGSEPPRKPGSSQGLQGDRPMPSGFGTSPQGGTLN